VQKDSPRLQDAETAVVEEPEGVQAAGTAAAAGSPKMEEERMGSGSTLPLTAEERALQRGCFRRKQQRRPSLSRIPEMAPIVKGQPMDLVVAGAEQRQRAVLQKDSPLQRCTSRTCH
jgi:hypothetical protein